MARAAGLSRGERRKDVAVSYRGEYLPDMLRSGWMRMRRRSVPLEVMPELAGQEDERLREMTAAVLALPDKYRETVVLFYYKQMKIREIAEALHIPQNSVSSRLRRARAMLQIDMEGGKDA